MPQIRITIAKGKVRAEGVDFHGPTCSKTLHALTAHLKDVREVEHKPEYYGPPVSGDAVRGEAIQ